jgi:hypothetical protein
MVDTLPVVVLVVLCCVVVLGWLVAALATQQAATSPPECSTMKKVSKETAAPLVAAAWTATKDLPEATPAMVEAIGFCHAGNPAPPGSGLDPMDGHHGSVSAAFNAIVLGCAGYRVPLALIVARLAAFEFDTNKGRQRGQYNPNHTTDLSGLKVHSSGHLTICKAGMGKAGWVAVNPDFLQAIGRGWSSLAEPTRETAAGLDKAGKATGKGLGKAATSKAKGKAKA